MRSKYVCNISLYFITLAVSLALAFELWRVILILILSSKTATVPALVITQSFLIGWRFDFSVACYITLPLFLLGALPGLNVARQEWVRAVHLILLGLISATVFFIHLADIPFFYFFGVRLNGTALLWTDSPGFMVSMIWDTYPVLKYMLLYLLLLGGFLWLMNRWMKRLVVDKTGTDWKVRAIWLLLAMVVFFFGGRGRFETKAPLRWGVAYFSEYDFANQLALNPTFTFLQDALYNAADQDRAEEIMSGIEPDNAESITRDLLGAEQPVGNAPPTRIIRPITHSRSGPPPNVILIIMESFGSSRIGCLENLWPQDLSPSFDSISQHGLLFTNFYSNGIHTYTGLFCSLYGYPHGLGKAVVKQVVGRNYFSGLPDLLRDQGYETVFFTTHDPHFDNMQGFLQAHGMERTVSVFDFDPEEKLSSMGVADHVLFDRAVAELGQDRDRPFFATILTGSNHGPWIIPDVPYDPLPEEVSGDEHLNSFKYSDWALGRFLRQIDTLPGFENTLLFVTADNGVSWWAKTDLDLTWFQIPLLIYNTSWTGFEGKRVSTLGSQMDIPATLMSFVGGEYNDATFGRDLFDTDTTLDRFVHLSEWQKIGLIHDDYFLIDRLDGESSLFRLDSIGVDLSESKPELANRMKEINRAIFTTAYRNAGRPLPTKADTLAAKSN